MNWKGFHIPLKVAFRGVAYREGALIEGPFGWGEYSPFPGYSEGRESACLEAARSSAFETWPAPVRDAVPVHVTIPALEPEAAAALAASSGCSSAKVKVAEGADEARLEAVRDALGPAGKITVDANGAWDVDEAVKQVRLLGRSGLELVEQPVRTVEEMRKLRRLIDVPIAADEAAATAEGAGLVARREAADVLVVKVQNMGGVGRALQVVEACGLPAVVSSLVETSAGLAAGVALAAALPELPFACGLGTAGLLETDVVKAPLLPVNGELEVRRPDVDLALLERVGKEISLAGVQGGDL